MKFNFKAEQPGAKIPTAHTEKSAGVDFYSNEDDTILLPGDAVNISTGVSWNPDFINFGYKVALIIQSRSGWAFNHGIESSNAGVIDMDYISTPEKKAIIHARLYNHSSVPFHIEKGMKICQGVPQVIPSFSDIEFLDDSRDGEGFGSSNNKG